MATPFDDKTVKDIETALGERITEIAQFALAFANGDHWQDGEGWIGPRLLDVTEGSETALAEIRRGFISKNVVKEIINRHTSALIGREPRWEFTLVRPLAEGEEPTDAEAALIDEAEAVMTTWWDERAVMKVLRTALSALLCTGRGPLRLYVPAGLLDPNEDDAYAGTVPPGDIPAQLARLSLDAPEPEICTVLTDSETRRQAGVLLYEVDKKTRVELSTVDGQETVVRVLEGTEVRSEARLPLGGNLLIAEMVREPLITEQVQGQQKVVNLALTMVPRNATLAGFMERVLTNAQLPGEWVDDPNVPEGKRFVPEPIAFGSGTVNNLLGLEIRDTETGQVRGYANPTISYKEPTPPGTFEDTKDLAYRCMLEECQQAHALISGLINVSSDSRRQAMADFLMSLLLSAPEVERTVRWLLDTALSLAAHFAGQSDRFAGLRAVVTTQIDTGPLTEADAQLAINLVGARLWSQQTGMAFVRVQDTDAEKAVIATEREAEGTVGERLLSAFERG